jgi:hypothetical protein
MNRATADNQSAQAEEEGLEPTKEWVKDLIDEILTEEFASPDLELHWLDEDKDAPEALFESRLKVGAVTLNEMRDALGLDPYDNAAADRPMVLTATGYVPIEANAQTQTANSERAAANGQSANAETQSAKLALGKASADDPEHPGWPAGTSGGRGGKFRPKGGEGESGPSTYASRAAANVSESPKRYAARDTGTLTDVSSVPGPALRYAAGAEEDDEPSGRIRGVPLKALGFPRDPITGRRIPSPPNAKTGDPEIDRTTERLVSIIDEVVRKIGPRPDLSPQKYGTRVHTDLAEMLRAFETTWHRSKRRGAHFQLD